jgi:hypothetical protein
MYDSPDPIDPEPFDIDQQIRINELREAAREAAGGEMTTWESPDMPPELAESFWGNVLAYESAEKTCHFIQLEQTGMELPAPETLSDEALSLKLWEVIDGLAKLNVFLSQTDHLSDRELYEDLLHDLLREITMDLPPNSGWHCHLDILGGCSEEDMQLHLKYYADDEYREQVRRDWPDEVVPDHVDPPYDRDSKLPKSPEP